MEVFRRWRAVLALCLALVLVACGQGTSEDEPATTGTEASSDGEVESGSIRISWQGPQERHNVTNAALDIFKSKHPDIELEIEFSGEDSYWERLATETAGGNMPDVHSQHVSYMSDYAARGALYDMNQLGDVLDLSSIDDRLKDAGTFDGELLGIPYGITAHSLFYDVEMIEQTGVEIPDFGYTWDEFEQLLTELVDKLPDGMYGSQDFSGHDSPLMQWARGKGKLLYTSDGELGITADDFREWLEMWQRFRDQGLVPSAEVTAASNFSVEEAPISQGLAPIEYRAANQLQAAATQLGKELGLMAFPTSNGEPPMYAIATGYWSIAADTDNPQAAGVLVDFLLNDPEGAAELRLDRGIPPSSAALESLDLEPAEQTMVDYVNRVIAEGTDLEKSRPAGSGEIEDILRRAAEGYALGSLTLDQAVDQFMAEASEALAG